MVDENHSPTADRSFGDAFDDLASANLRVEWAGVHSYRDDDR
jgi:hypothetical protein